MGQAYSDQAGDNAAIFGGYSQNVITIPEPAGLALLALGLPLLAFARRRRA